MSEVKANKISPATSTVVTLGDSSDTFVVATGAKIDINGTELILDADADTSITADTDDQIDIRIAGADDFQFTANTFTAAASSVVALDDGAVATPALTNTGDLNTGLYFPAADTVGITAGGTEQFRFGSNPIPGGSKNMLINGAMMVNQRGSTTATVNAEHLDRFASTLYDTGTSAVATVTKDSDSPTGFGSSMKFDVTTIATGGGDYNHVRQRIEGQNVQHLKYGTADALTCTFSFWFKTTITGIYSALLYHIDGTETIVTEFTVASSNTWEFFQIAFPGNTDEAFDDDANGSLEVGITLASDSATASSNDVWQAGGDTGGSVNQVNGLSSTSNNILTTGWQFEVGSIATDFAHEDYGTTLNKCLRYFEKQNYVVNTFGAVGFSNTTTSHQMLLQFTEKRATGPTIAVSTASQWEVNRSGTDQQCTALAGSSPSKVGMTLIATVSSGLTTGEAAVIRSNYSTNYITISSEI